jgi:glyceraldehyde 3-phosphate dehydrogenase
VRQKSDAVLDSWVKREALAEEMIPLVGRLYRENNVVTSVYGRTLINQSVVGLLKAHRFARQIDDVELPLERRCRSFGPGGVESGAASVDLARLSLRYKQSGGGQPWWIFSDGAGRSGRPPGNRGAQHKRRRVIRLRAYRPAARANHARCAGAGSGLRLRAIVVRRGSDQDLVKRASLLRRDSVHGPFEGRLPSIQRTTRFWRTARSSR